MTPSQSLSKLNSKIDRRLLKIRRNYNACRNANCDHPYDLLAVTSIELDNLVLSSVRCLLISSLFLATTSSGMKISSARRFSSEQQVGAFFLETLNPVKFRRQSSPLAIRRTEEPTIRFPREARMVLNAALASNLPSFDQAMALNTNVFDNLSTIRNFFAHRNADTWHKVRVKAQNSGYFNIKMAGEYLNARIPGRPVSIMEDWLDDVYLFFQFALQ